jgi:hypothetical protein
MADVDLKTMMKTKVRPRTVGDLIEALRQFPQDVPIYFDGKFSPSMVREIRVQFRASLQPGGEPTPEFIMA